MKKLIGVSLIAILTVGAAHAAPEYADAVPVEPISITANTHVASTSYVQGAYNEAIKAVNKENQRALAAEGDLTTLTTTTKTSLVGAINSLKTEISDIDTGVQSVTTGDATSGAGTIKVDGNAVSVYGLGSAAFTEASAYATAAQGALADSAVQSVTTGDATSGAGTIKVDGNAVSVYGLGSAAYVNTGALADTAGTYDNTTSHLTATTIQDAIDEVAGTAGNAIQSVAEGATNGTIAVDGTDVTVHGLGSAAFADTTDFDAAGDAAAAEAAAKAYADAKFLDVYTTWNADTHQPVNLSNPTNP